MKELRKKTSFKPNTGISNKQRIFEIVAAFATGPGKFHYPFYLLIADTFLLALVYTLIYLRLRNLWMLGIFHRWLGCLFFFFVLERAPPGRSLSNRFDRDIISEGIIPYGNLIYCPFLGNLSISYHI